MIVWFYLNTAEISAFLHIWFFSVIHSYFLLWMWVLTGIVHVFAKETEGVSGLFWCSPISHAVSTDCFRFIWETKVDSYCYSRHILFRECRMYSCSHLKMGSEILRLYLFQPIGWKSNSPLKKKSQQLSTKLIHYVHKCTFACWLNV